MSDYAAAWELSRKRLVDEIAGLNAEQLNWRLYPGALSIGQMGLHVAGVEIFFSSQLTGAMLDDFSKRLLRCSTEGVVNELPFPYSDEEITPESVSAGLAAGEAAWRPLVTEAAPEIRVGQITSALGPIISGDGAFARLSFHSGYHQGQAFQVKCAPGFPK